MLWAILKMKLWTERTWALSPTSYAFFTCSFEIQTTRGKLKLLGSWGSSEIPNRSSLTLLPLLWNSLFSPSECTLSISCLVRIQTSISTVIEIWCYIVKWTNRLVFYLEAKLELREADFVLRLTHCKTNLIKLGWWRHSMWVTKDIPSSTFLLERIRMHPIYQKSANLCWQFNKVTKSLNSTNRVWNLTWQNLDPQYVLIFEAKFRIIYYINNIIKIYIINIIDFNILLLYIITYIIYIYTQSCPALGSPMDSRPPSSSVHGISQATILEWVAISFSRGSSWTRNQAQAIHIIL